MVLSSRLLIFLPIAVILGIPLWLMIFLNTYRHFPNMNPKERLWMCISSATSLTAILLGIVYLFLWFIMQNLIG